MPGLDQDEDVVAPPVVPFFSSNELRDHNVSSDCWVSYFGAVYDLTPLIAENRGLLVRPILKFAGQVPVFISVDPFFVLEASLTCDPLHNTLGYLTLV
jgi:hypothetical protein